MNGAAQDDYLSAIAKPIPSGMRIGVHADKNDLSGLATAEPTTNPKGEGLYQMTLGGGKFVGVPYSNVMSAHGAGYRIKPIDRVRYTRDRRAEILKQNPDISDQDYFKQLQLPDAVPDSTSAGRFGRSLERGWQAVRDKVQSVTEPTNVYPGMPTSFTDPAATEAGLNTIKRVGRVLFGVADMPPQAFGALKDVLSGDPQTSYQGAQRFFGLVNPTAQIVNRVQELQDDWHKDPKLAATNVAGDAIGIWLAGKAGELPGKVMRSPYLTEKVPHEIIQRLIKSQTPDLTFGKDPAQAILDHGIVGKNLRTIGDGVYDKLHEIGKKIDDVAKNPVNAGKRVNVGGALKPFDDAIVEASQQKPVNVKLYKALIEARNELYLEYVEAAKKSGGATLRPIGPANLVMSPEDALRFKRNVGDRINWNKDPIQGKLNQAYGKAYGITKDALNKELGQKFAKLNDQYADLVGAAKSIERQIPVEERGAHWKLTDIVLGATGHPVIAAARIASHHPGVRSRGARFLHNLPQRAPVRGGAFERTPAAFAAVHTATAPRKGREDKSQPAAPPPAQTVAVAAPKPKPSPAQLKSEVAERNPSNPPNPPNKQYAETQIGPNGHRIGSDDGGRTVYDIQTGQRLK